MLSKLSSISKKSCSFTRSRLPLARHVYRPPWGEDAGELLQVAAGGIWQEERDVRLQRQMERWHSFCGLCHLHHEVMCVWGILIASIIIIIIITSWDLSSYSCGLLCANVGCQYSIGSESRQRLCVVSSCNWAGRLMWLFIDTMGVFCPLPVVKLMFGICNAFSHDDLRLWCRNTDNM